MKETIFLQDENAVWLKGNLHSHSNFSDGKLTPEEMKEAYKSHGYDFLAVSDHDIYTDTRHLSDDKFTMIQGFELWGNNYSNDKDIHVHFPEGAVPKDGPSAGVTVCTAMVSALTGTSVRSDVAMTGEISIRGRVLPIGGLKEKTMAALRHGIRTVIIPKENEKDLQEIDQTVRRALNFVSAQTVDAVLDTALNKKIHEVSAPLLNGIPEEVKSKGRKPDIRQ